MTNNRGLELLLVDDDDELRTGMANFFRQVGHEVQEAESAEVALERLDQRVVDVVILDMVMPGMSGIDLLEKIKQDHIEGEIVLLTGEGTIEKAVEAMKLGAYDFLSKPVRMKQLEAIVLKAAESSTLRKENRQLRALSKRNAPKHHMIGNSPAMQEVYRLIDRSGPSDKPILIQGESGTGKELVARALHEASSRADKPLVVVKLCRTTRATLGE